MGFFNKLKASVGIGGAKVEIKLAPGPVPKGGFARGEVCIKGGKLAQKLNGVVVELERTKVVASREEGKEVLTDDTDTLYEENLADYEQDIEPGQEWSYDFAIQIPNEAEGNHPITYEICASLDIPGAIDPSCSVKVPLTDAQKLTEESLPQFMDVAKTLQEQGYEKYTELEALLRQVLTLQPTNTSALKWIAEAVAFRSDAEASEFYRRYLEVVPTDAEMWYAWSSSAESRDAYDEALGYAQKACELTTGRSHYWQHQADLLSKLKRYDEAIAAMDQALEGDDGDAYTQLRKGAILKDAGRTQEAVEVYLQAAEGESVYMLDNVLEALQELGVTDHHDMLINKFTEEQPEEYEPWYEKAKWCLKKNDGNGCIGAIEVALKHQGPSDYERSQFQVLLGMAHEILGQRDNAKSAYKAALSADDDNDEAKDRLKRV